MRKRPISRKKRRHGFKARMHGNNLLKQTIEKPVRSNVYGLFASDRLNLIFPYPAMLITLTNPFISFLLRAGLSASASNIVTRYGPLSYVSLFGYVEEVEAGVHLGVEKVVSVINFTH